MISNKLISIIIPVYNVEPYLKRCLDSIIKQSYKNIEIIIIDDGSTDNSGKICDEYKRIDNRVIVIHKKNSGVSSARNVGLSIAKGEYIGFVDSDDYVEKNIFENLVKNLENNDADISMCNYYIEKNGKVYQHNKNSIGKYLIIDNKCDFYRMLNKNYYKGYLWNKLFKKEKINGILFKTDIHMCEDLLWISTIAEKCDKFVFDYTCLYHYVIRENSAYNGKINKKFVTVCKAYESIIEIIEQYDKDIKLEYEITYFYWLNDICKQYKGFSEVERKKYKAVNKRIYKEIQKNKKVGIKYKIELFIRYRMYYFFVFMKRIKKIYTDVSKK